MRCEHMVEKAHPFTGRKRFRVCRHRLELVESRLILGGCRWHVYRCRRRHETRILVGTDPLTGPSGQYADGR